MEDTLAGIDRNPVDVDPDNLRTDSAGHKYFTRPGGTLMKAVPMHSSEAIAVASELVGAVREIIGAAQSAPAPIVHITMPAERKPIKYIGGRDEAGNPVMRPVYDDAPDA